MKDVKLMTLQATMRWHNDSLEILDQTLLPQQVSYRCCSDTAEVAEAICKLRVRGAPAIGAAAAFGVVLAVPEQAAAVDAVFLRQKIDSAVRQLAATRPTAVNLFWALQRMQRKAAEHYVDGAASLRQALLSEAAAILAEDIAQNKKMGIWGAELIADGARILTHCNAGALATGGYGTALGVLRAAAEQGKRIKVYADETRPLLQGARLTAWELQQDNIDVTVIADSAAGFLMERGMIDLVITGADRIAANGDTANKIGTYSLAVLAREHSLPFYIAAPCSTFDLQLADGQGIAIEQRAEQEISTLAGVALVPAGVPALNLAFDITPHRYLSAIITERGVIRPPFVANIAAMYGQQTENRNCPMI